MESPEVKLKPKLKKPLADEGLRAEAKVQNRKDMARPRKSDI